MKVTARQEKINPLKSLVIGFDTGKDDFCAYSEFVSKSQPVMLEDRFANNVATIRRQLAAYKQLCAENGYEELVVACEPSGVYEKKLMEMARKLGNKTYYVSGEATSKAKVIESNDIGKSDPKDARTVFLLTRMERVLTHSPLEGDHLVLRQMGGDYEDVCLLAARLKNQISSLLDVFFCDLKLDRDFLYSDTGMFLMSEFKLNPWLIARLDWREFLAKVRGGKCKAREATLRTVYDSAMTSILMELQAEVKTEIEGQLVYLFEMLRKALSRKKRLRAEMEEIFRKTPEGKKLVCIPKANVFLLARIIAETGPLSRFKSVLQLLRYAGLNIRLRESGRYVGERKISKKGRPLLRKVLYQLAYSCLIANGRLYHDFFSKKKVDLRNGGKAIVAVMRKVLKMIFGVAKSMAFDERRVFMCESECFRLKA